MDKEKLKLIVQNLELLVNSLKNEVYSNTENYLNCDKMTPYLSDYDEVFEDNDDYGV
jgi:hypothetical protein